MAVTTLTATTLVKDTMSADLAITSGTAIDASKTMEVAYPQEGKLLLVLNNTFAGAKVFTVDAGDFNIASQKGALAMSLAQDDVRFLVVSSDRFKKQTGVLSLSFEASTTGYVMAFLIP